MDKAPNLIGRRFTGWTVIERAVSRRGRSRWRCSCVCGNSRVVLGQALTSGESRCCGCMSGKLRGARNDAMRRAAAALQALVTLRDLRLEGRYVEASIREPIAWSKARAAVAELEKVGFAEDGR